MTSGGAWRAQAGMTVVTLSPQGLCVSGQRSLIADALCKDFLPVCRASFHFLDDVISSSGVSNLGEVQFI